MTTIYIIALLFALVYFTLEAFHLGYVIKMTKAYDCNQLKRLTRSWYTMDAAIKTLEVSTVVTLAFILVFPGLTIIQYLVEIIRVVAIVMIFRWIWFDIVFNYLRQYPLLYKNNEGIARICESWGLYFIIKISSLALLVLSYTIY